MSCTDGSQLSVVCTLICRNILSLHYKLKARKVTFRKIKTLQKIKEITGQINASASERSG